MKNIIRKLRERTYFKLRWFRLDPFLWIPKHDILVHGLTFEVHYFWWAKWEFQLGYGPEEGNMR